MLPRQAKPTISHNGPIVDFEQVSGHLPCLPLSFWNTHLQTAGMFMGQLI